MKRIGRLPLIIFGVAAASLLYAADLKISELAAGAPPAAEDLVVIARGGANYSLKINDLRTVWLVSDSTIQVGQLVMPDSGTDGRVDVATTAKRFFGVATGSAACAQGTYCQIAVRSLAYVAPGEDYAVERNQWLLDLGNGYSFVDPTGNPTGAIDENVGEALYSEPVTNTINPAGCTGSNGCINTALDTPNLGPAGQITLSANVETAGWAVGEPVIYWSSGGTTPTGLTDGAVYWLVSVSGANVTISASKGGSVIVPSSQGDDATQYLQRLPLSIISPR